MINLIRYNVKKFHFHEKLLVLLPIIILIFPLLIFGSPKLYNDDFHFIEAINEIGTFEAIKSWINEYGVFYRPVAIILLYAIYYTLQDLPFFLYLFSYLCFIGLCLVSWKAVSNCTSSRTAGLITLVFTSSFVFSSTAFLQNSSSCMNWGAMFSLYLFYCTYKYKLYYSHKPLIFLNLIWLLLCFNYEQVLGISCTFICALYARHISGSFKELFKKLSKPILYFGISSLLFLASYLIPNSNPKISTLKKFNQQQTTQSNSIPLSGEQKEETLDPRQKRGRLEGLKRKLIKAHHFLVRNYSYSLTKIKEQGISGYLYLLLLFSSFFIFLVSKTNLPNFQTSLSLLFIGVAWSFFTIIPFLLYKNFQMPPYTLTIPSIGFGFITASIPGIINKYFGKRPGSVTAKIILSTIIVIFPISQTGYYFGLKEELAFWDKIRERVLKTGAMQQEININLLNLPKKGNDHIFWINKTIGTRYLYSTLPKHLKDYKIHYQPGRKLRFFRANSNIERTINF